MTDFSFISSDVPMKIFNPCRATSPLLTLGGMTAVPFIAVACQKDNGHDGDHEWVLRWRDE